MLTIFLLSLVAAAAQAATIQGTPQMLSWTAKTLRPWDGNSQNFPDGKTWAVRENPVDSQSSFIMNIVPNFRLSGPSSLISDLNTSAGANESLYPDAIPNMSGVNWVQLPSRSPVLSATQTGLRGNGTLYDEGSWWIMSAFRLAETSQQSVNQDHMIGFEHNEDYWQNTGVATDCTYKSIGVRYSDDLGLSWTRSLPILTSRKQPDDPKECDGYTGIGDFAAMWQPIKKEWIVYAQAGPLVMSRSSDPLASPGSWENYDPVNSTTAPGFIGPASGQPLAHGDLETIPGSNPSIIYDEITNKWHMVWAKWGGGLAYANTQDLYRWSKPIMILPSVTGNGGSPNAIYPSLIGTEGDALTTNGKAMLYFTSTNTQASFGRPLYAVGISFN